MHRYGTTRQGEQRIVGDRNEADGVRFAWEKRYITVRGDGDASHDPWLFDTPAALTLSWWPKNLRGERPERKDEEKQVRVRILSKTDR